MAKPQKITGEQLDNFRGMVFEVLPEMLEDYIAEVRMSEDVDDKRKFMAWATTVVGAEAKKDDAKPALPVFNFNFSLGSVQAQAAQLVEQIDQCTGAVEVVPAEPTAIAAPAEMADQVADAFAQINKSLA